MFPDDDPVSVRYLRWCWKQPVYLGFPLALGVFLICVWDAAYILSWWARHWGTKNPR